MTKEERRIIDSLTKLKRSTFRSKFHLEEKEKKYIAEKGLVVIQIHAFDFIRSRLALADIPNDGRQTPMHGHPVFIAQHATATCCRKCLYQWHRIPPGVPLSEEQQNYVVALIMEWLRRQTPEK